MAATHRTKLPSGERVKRKRATLSSHPFGIEVEAILASAIASSFFDTSDTRLETPNGNKRLSLSSSLCAGKMM
jgi:hypothetical protein